MKSFLQWWLMFCLILIGFLTTGYFDFYEIIYKADITKLSFVSMGIFFLTSIWIGKKTLFLCKMKKDDKLPSLLIDNIGIGWFISEALLAIGMVGTVIGFLYMLGTSFENINVNDAATLQDSLVSMAKGMSTALYTTLMGLITSLLIKVQLVNYENEGHR